MSQDNRDPENVWIVYCERELCNNVAEIHLCTDCWEEPITSRQKEYEEKYEEKIENLKKVIEATLVTANDKIAKLEEKIESLKAHIKLAENQININADKLKEQEDYWKTECAKQMTAANLAKNEVEKLEAENKEMKATMERVQCIDLNHQKLEEEAQRLRKEVVASNKGAETNAKVNQLFADKVLKLEEEAKKREAVISAARNFDLVVENPDTPVPSIKAFVILRSALKALDATIKEGEGQ